MRKFLITLAVSALLFSYAAVAFAATLTPDNTASDYTAAPQAATAAQQKLHEPTGSVTTASPTLPRGTVNDNTVKLVLVIAAAAAVAVLLIFYKRHKNED